MKIVDFSGRKNLQERIKKMDELFIIFTQIMNKVHNVNFSERFWRILLQGYISTVVSRYDDFNNKKVAFDVILPTGAKKVSFKRKFHTYLRYLFMVFKTRNNKSKINYILQNESNICISTLFGTTLPNGVKEILPDYYYFPIIAKKNHKKRKSLKIASENYSDLYLQNIILSVPKIFIEDFEKLMKEVPLFDEINKTFHITIFSNTYSRYIVAKYVENGAKLFGYQHGSNYGETRFHPAYYYENSISDKYHTWGWKINENDNPYFAFRIKKFIDKYESTTVDIKYDCLIVFGRFLDWNKDKYLEKGLFFAKNIDRTKYPNVLVRPRKENKRSDATGNLMFLKKYDFILDEGIRNEAPLIIKQSKIVILLHYPSTFAFECMSVNHPVLCIIETNEISDMALPYYRKMYELKIFHNDIESVVDFLNDNDINKWWKKVLEDQRFHDFKNNFLKNNI